MALSLVTVARIRAPARPARRRAPSRWWQSVRAGLAFLFTRPIFLGAMTLDLLAVLFGGAVAILPIFAEEILHVGPQGLGALRAAPALGAVLMSGLLALRPPPRRAGRTFFSQRSRCSASSRSASRCRAGSGCRCSLLAASGAADMLSVYFRGTLMQVLVPSEMLGRVSAVNQIFIGSSNEIGAFESGVAARLLGHGSVGGRGRRHHRGGHARHRLARAGAPHLDRLDDDAGRRCRGIRGRQVRRSRAFEPSESSGHAAPS